MKRSILLVVVLGLFISACQKNAGTPRYKNNSKEYLFFKTLSGKTPLLDPDQRIKLISTNRFSLYTTDILPRFFSISRRQPSSFQEMQKDVLNNYVNQIASQRAQELMLLTSAKDRGITVPADSVEQKLNLFMQQQGGKEAYDQVIASHGMTLDLVRSDIRTGMTIDRLVKEVLFKDIRVTDQDIKADYEREKYATIRQIVVGISGKKQTAVDSIRKKMDEIVLRARKGEDFTRLVKTYSDDKSAKNGYYENVSRHAMLKSFEDVIFGMPVGTISDVMSTPNGLFIIKVEKRGKESRPFDKVKDGLRAELIQAKQRQVFTAYVDSLKAGYKYTDLVSQILL
jgi:parvulin-like peptidyl-prolyl isomerase